jgi:hypothetical protein
MYANPSICIPRVFSNMSEDRVRRAINNANFAVIAKIDMITRVNDKGEEYKRVFIHFESWFNTHDAKRIRDDLLAGKDFKIMYDNPWYWKVAASKWSPKPNVNSVKLDKDNDAKNVDAVIEFLSNLSIDDKDEFGRDISKRSEPRRDDSRREDSRREDSRRDDSRRDDSRRDDSRDSYRRDDSRREDSRREDSRRDDSRRDDSRRDDSRDSYRRDSYRREDSRDSYRREDSRRDDSRDSYRREEPRDSYRRDSYRREDSRDSYRREEPRRDEPRDSYRREEPRDSYRREEPRREDSRDSYRREEPRREEPRRDEPRDSYRREEPRREEPRREEPIREEPIEYKRGDYKKEIQPQIIVEEKPVQVAIAVSYEDTKIQALVEFDHFNEMKKNPQWVRDQREFERENEVDEVICWGDSIMTCPKKRTRRIIA